MFNIRVTPPLLWTAGTIWPVVCTLVVLARFKVRSSSRAHLSWDDWLTIPALILIFGMAATILTGTGLHTLGRPTPPTPPDIDPQSYASRAQIITRKTFFIITILSTVALTFIKLSCMLFYYRLFRIGFHRVQKVLYYTFTTLIVIWGLGFTFAYAFNCGTHWLGNWTSLTEQMKCPVSTTPILLGLSISDTIMDAIIFVYPIPFILKLQISTMRKLGLLVVFILGAAAISVSTLRLVIIVKALNAQFAAKADQVFLSTAGDYFPFIECGFALCAICLPTLSGVSKPRAGRSKSTTAGDGGRGSFSIFGLLLKSSSSSSPSATTTTPPATLRRSSTSEERRAADYEGEKGLNTWDTSSKARGATRTQQTS